MKKTKEQLENRIKKLTDERKKCVSKYNSNRQKIIETNIIIERMKSISDEALEIFSPKFRETNTFNQHEIKELGTKIVTIAQINNELAENIKKIDKEISEINVCLKEISKQLKEGMFHVKHSSFY